MNKDSCLVEVSRAGMLAIKQSWWQGHGLEATNSCNEIVYSVSKQHFQHKFELADLVRRCFSQDNCM